MLYFDQLFLKTENAKWLIFRWKWSRKIHNSTMDPGCIYDEKFRGAIQWYMMENKDFISNISFEI